MPQCLYVLFVTNDRIHPLRPIHVVVVRPDAAVGVPIGLQEAVLVALGAGDGDDGEFLSAGGFSLADGHEEQAAVFDGGHRVVLLAEAGDKVEVALVGLVQVRDFDGFELGADGGFQVVFLGEGAEDVAEGGVVPAAFAFFDQGAAHVGAAGADAEHVGRAAVLGFVDGEGAFVHQAGVTPAEPHLQGGAAWGNGEEAVAVAELDVERVRLGTAVVGEGEVDEAGGDVGCDVVAVHGEAVDGFGVAHRRMFPRVSRALPSRSMRLSSTRCRCRLNSMRRAAPSWKKRVRVSLRLSITQRP
ncbi:hypothetical protein FQZ97_875250 [compost metagenome]